MYGYERMDLLVFHFTVFFRLLQFTSCLKYLFCTMSVWNRLRVVLFIYMVCTTRKDSCVSEFIILRFFFVLNLTCSCVVLIIWGPVSTEVE